MPHVLAQDLRNAVLQAALQGKLSEQLCTDSNVDELFQNIKAEKNSLIKGKLLKKEKPLLSLAEDKIPFDIPESWMWCNIGDVLTLQAGKNTGASTIKDHQYDSYVYPCYGGNGIRGYKDEFNTTGFHAIIGRQGALCGNINYANGEFYATEHAVVVYAYAGCDMSCIGLFLKALNLNQYATATAQPGISVEKIIRTPFPLPPIEEQARIVARVDEHMAKIDEYEKIEKQLMELRKAFPGAMKDAILQAAMQGKLTEQLESDGDVYEYFDSITQKRKKLIKEKQLKKESCLDSQIDETPFDIPDSWRWCYLGECIHLTSGADLTPDKYNDKGQGIVYITGASNIENGKVIVNRWTDSPRNIAKKGDLLLTCKGTVGTTCFLDLDEAHIARQIMSIRPIDVHPQYINAFISYYVNQLKAMAKSMIPGIERKNVLTALFPLPPIEEQQRIVEKLDQLLPLCEQLERVIS